MLESQETEDRIFSQSHAERVIELLLILGHLTHSQELFQKYVQEVIDITLSGGEQSRRLPE